jgi:hypothetical protein
MGLLPVRPAEVLLSYTGPDRERKPPSGNIGLATPPFRLSNPLRLKMIFTLLIPAGADNTAHTQASKRPAAQLYIYQLYNLM